MFKQANKVQIAFRDRIHHQRKKQIIIGPTNVLVITHHMIAIIKMSIQVDTMKEKKD